MWLSTRKGQEQEDGGWAEVAAISLGGSAPTVMGSGGQTPVTLFAPGGYLWTPKRGDGILVIKAGGTGEEDCGAGMEMTPSEELAPGEVRLYSEGAALTLRNDGRIELTGKVFVNGEEIGCG